MNALFVAAGIAAIADWWSVLRDRRRLESLFKPLTIALLAASAFFVDSALEPRRTWFLGALFFSLLGDVFLLPGVDRFIHGLGAFLVAQLAYVGGFVSQFIVEPPAANRMIAGVALVAILLPMLGVRIARAAPRAYRGPIVVYMGVLSAMVALAIASGSVFATAGGALFYASDAMIGWRRFIEDEVWMPLAIIVTYHLAQAALVLSLAR